MAKTETRKIKTYNPFNEKVESYYIVCRNNNEKYQLVAYPWNRIDAREYDTPEDAFNDLSTIVSKRGLKTTWCIFHISDVEDLDET